MDFFWQFFIKYFDIKSNMQKFLSCIIKSWLQKKFWLRPHKVFGPIVHPVIECTLVQKLSCNNSCVAQNDMFLTLLVLLRFNSYVNIPIRASFQGKPCEFKWFRLIIKGFPFLKKICNTQSRDTWTGLGGRGGGHWPPSLIFGRSVIPISTSRGGRFWPPFTTGTLKIFHLPASLQSNHLMVLMSKKVIQSLFCSWKSYKAEPVDMWGHWLPQFWALIGVKTSSLNELLLLLSLPNFLTFRRACKKPASERRRKLLDWQLQKFLRMETL